jgi:WD40 repeat protein
MTTHFSKEIRGNVRRFQKTRLAQVIQAHDGPVYALKFSPDGKYLATGGDDAKVVVWVVGQLRRLSYEGDEDDDNEGGDFLEHEGGSYKGDSPYPQTPQAYYSRGGHHPSFSTTPTGSPKGPIATEEQQPPSSTSQHQSTPDEHSPSISLDESDKQSSAPSGGSSGAALGFDKNVILFPAPYREYLGHTESVLDVAWSGGSNLLLSASADKYVRLWRLEDRSGCLKLFGHTDIVTSVAFHPTNHAHFISGCFNGQVRLWDNVRSNTLDYVVSPLDENNCNVAITSVSFVPDGSRVFAGLKDGQIQIYAYKMEFSDKVKLQRETSLDWLRDRKGKYSNGRKVTGICFDSSKGSDAKLLRWCVTSNDDNIRLVDSVVPPFKYVCKYKGGRNANLQIKASFSEDGKYIICAGENGRVNIWETERDSSIVDVSCAAVFRPKKQPGVRRNSIFEWFQATGKSPDGGKMLVPATTVAFAPAASVHRLLESAVEAQRRRFSGGLVGRPGSPSDLASLPSATRSASTQVSPVPVSTNSSYLLPDDGALCVSIIASTDLDGKLRIFLCSPLVTS